MACAWLSLDGGTGAKLRADVAASACLGSAHVLRTIAGRIVRLSNRPSSDSDSLRVECISVRRPPTQCRSASVACRRVRSQRPALVAADSATLAEKQVSKAVSHRAASTEHPAGCSFKLVKRGACLCGFQRVSNANSIKSSWKHNNNWMVYGRRGVLKGRTVEERACAVYFCTPGMLSMAGVARS